ncbi:hypothetical protein BGX12_1422 [Fibrobacter sp. UWR4]|nr:hypothetical protein BGX12_1422 [Fibrobacter sp. UWR4]PZW63696.1 hypothetical protein C8E88_10422 [Fibrobacter sp. UWR1]
MTKSFHSKIEDKTMSRVHYNEEMKLQTVKIVLKGEKSTSREARPLQACLQKGMPEA